MIFIVSDLFLQSRNLRPPLLKTGWVGFAQSAMRQPEKRLYLLQCPPFVSTAHPAFLRRKYPYILRLIRQRSAILSYGEAQTPPYLPNRSGNQCVMQGISAIGRPLITQRDDADAIHNASLS